MGSEWPFKDPEHSILPRAFEFEIIGLRIEREPLDGGEPFLDAVPVGDANRLYPGIPTSNPASFTFAIHEGLGRLWMRCCGILRACRAWRFRMELESLESAIGLRCRVSGWDGKGRTKVRPYER